MISSGAATGFGGRWYVDADPGWFGGQWWWVAVTAGAGVVVGLLRRVTGLPEQIPGLIADLKDGHVDPRLVPGIAVVSAVSLIGGASLGPEKALGSLGGGAGSWIAQRRKLSAEDAQLSTMSGFGGAYGGLFSSTVIVVMLILEIRTCLGMLVAVEQVLPGPVRPMPATRGRPPGRDGAVGAEVGPVDQPSRNAHRVTEPSIARAGCELHPSAGSRGPVQSRAYHPAWVATGCARGVLGSSKRVLRQHRVGGPDHAQR